MNWLNQKVLAAITCFLLTAGTAQAATVSVSFSTFFTGEDLGAVELATLEATQLGGDVEIVFTNTAFAHANSFETQLYLGYGGPADSSVGLTNVSGVATDSFQTNAGSFVNADATFDILVAWGTSNKGGGISRLEPGESSTFLLTDALLSLLFGGSGRDPFAMIHVQGLNSGNSTKYVGTIAPVPLPAALPLFAGGLGLFGLMGWLSKRAVI